MNLAGFWLRWLLVRAFLGPACRTARCGRLAGRGGLCVDCEGVEALESVVRG